MKLEDSNPFYQLADFYERLAEAVDDSRSEQFFKANFSELDTGSARLFVLSLFQEAMDGAAYLALADHRISRIVEETRQAQVAFLLGCSATKVSELKSNLAVARYAPLFQAHGNALAGLNLPEVVDRSALLEATYALMKDVDASSMPDYAKRVLNLKLNSVARIVAEASYLSDGEIRRRVKAVYADFCSEFMRYDKAHEEFGEKLWRWARTYSGYGIFALALTADASAVAGLLTGPSPSK